MAVAKSYLKKTSVGKLVATTAITNGGEHEVHLYNEDDFHLQSNRAQHCMATLNNLALGLILRLKPKYATVPDERRRYCATPEEAFKLLIRSTPV
jgi:hypothetical protein